MRIDRQFIAIAIAGSMGVTLAACGGGAKPAAISADEPSLGKADAPVTMVEYASTACGHCAMFNNNTFHAFKEKHIDTGEVRYAMREILTPPESFAAASFILARCVPSDKYYPVIDAVFRAQGSIFQSGDLAGGLKQIGLAAGLTEDQYNKCVTDEAAREALIDRVQQNLKFAETTPTFYINGEKMPFSGEVSLEVLSKAVADAKAKAK